MKLDLQTLQSVSLLVCVPLAEISLW